MKTVLITGCSSGFGLETARYFLARDWQVIATMRRPRPEVLPASSRLRLLALDVTDRESIREAAELAGPVDVLVNNAGVGLLSVLEGTSLETIRATFETNTFGAMAVTQALLPQLRERQGSVIVNVSSSTTYAPLPMLAVYTASEAALNAFTESLALELAPFDVRVRLVIPGQAPETPFGSNARTLMGEKGVHVPEPYAGFAAQVFARMGQARSGPVTHPSDVAEAVFRAATEPSTPVRLPAGADAQQLAGGA